MASASGTRIRICRTAQFSRPSSSASAKATSACSTIRETEVRPNALIELGVAIGTGKPYFYLNYQKKRKIAIARRKEVITTANDLAGVLYMPYTSYEDVCLELAMRLPGFLVDSEPPARRVRDVKVEVKPLGGSPNNPRSER